MANPLSDRGAPEMGVAGLEPAIRIRTAGCRKDTKAHARLNPPRDKARQDGMRQTMNFWAYLKDSKAGDINTKSFRKFCDLESYI